MTEAKNMSLVGHNDLNGRGDGMHINVVNGYAFVGHQGHTDVGTSILDVSNPENPKVVAQIPRPDGAHSHKVQVVGDVMVVNHEKNFFAKAAPSSWSSGLAIYDVSKAAEPRQIGFFETPGNGVHRMTYWEEPYVFMSATADGFINKILRILDLSDPSQPKEIGRWWYPGQNEAGGEPLTWVPARQRPPAPGEEQWVLHHGLPRGDRLYCGYWDAGVIILDISDIEKPSMISRLTLDSNSSETHTAMPVPGRDLLVVTDEAVSRKLTLMKHTRVIDISDEANPKEIAKFPVVAGNLGEKGIRFGPHNLHEPRPGSYIDSNTVYLTYFAGGLRAYDISDPTNPTEIAYFVPDTPYRLPDSPKYSLEAPMFNDVHVAADGMIYVTDRHGGGLYIVEHTR